MKVLFVFAEDATFVRMDYDILQRFADVTPFRAPPGTRLSAVARSLRLHDLAFVWFGLGHASRLVVSGRILRKPVVLVGGGWDVADMPEISYGAARTTYGRARAAFTFGLASLVLAFSRWSAGQIRSMAPRARVEPVYLGVDTDAWTPAAKEPLVLTIGSVTPTNLRRKGLETFARASRQLPSVRFVLAGRADPDAAARLRSVGGPNLELAGHLDDADLRSLASHASVYVQPSVTEGFGLAVAEAMSAGCVPVVSRVASLPEVVDDCGFYVAPDDQEAVGAAIRRALESPDLGRKARERVRNRFPLQARADALRRVLRDLTGT